MTADIDIETEVEQEVVEQEIDEQPPVEENQEPSQEDLEARARRFGWKPEEEYKGNDNWVDAKTFLDMPENDPQYLKKALRGIERNYEKLEKSTEAILEHQNRMIEKEREDAYAQAVAATEAKFKAAVENGDQEAANEAWREKEQLTQKQVEQTTQDKVVEAWLADNTWFNTDPVMQDYAGKYQAMLEQQGVSLEESLSKTTEYIKGKFPAEFEQSDSHEGKNEGKGKQPAYMPTGGENKGRPPAKGKPGTYEGLNKEAKAQCDNFVKGMLKDNPNRKKEDVINNFLSYAAPEMFE